MEFKSLIWPEGKVNPSGICSKIYFIPKSHIVSFPKAKNDAAATTLDEHVNLQGDFVLDTDKKWFELYSTQGKGSVTSEGTGEKDCKLFTEKGTFSFPDTNDEGRNMMKAFINANIVMVVPFPDGTYHVLGDEYYDSESGITSTTGDTPGSAKGVTIEITSYAVTPLARYTGELVLENGTLDCATGVFTKS